MLFHSSEKSCHIVPGSGRHHSGRAYTCRWKFRRLRYTRTRSALACIPGLRAFALARQPDLGRKHPRFRHLRTGSPLGQRAAGGLEPQPPLRTQSRGNIRRWQQVHRAEKLPQRRAEGLFHPAGRMVRDSGDRRRQPNHRQPDDRHESRWHGYRLLHRNVRVSNCTVNSPRDDAIVPKSSFSLGYARATENVTISNCYVTGTYEMGSVLDGTLKKFPVDANVPRIGRIKLGTESNGGFKNIAISNCVFEGCHSLALETGRWRVARRYLDYEYHHARYQ